MSNEYKIRRALVSAFGGTGSVVNEDKFDASLIAAVKSSIPKTKPAVVALTAVSTANATDLATAIALANANKTAINAIIAALKA